MGCINKMAAGLVVTANGGLCKTQQYVQQPMKLEASSFENDRSVFTREGGEQLRANKKINQQEKNYERATDILCRLNITFQV